MNETQPTNDDLHDAATDRLLAEALGGESPPDLRDAVVDRYEAGRPEAPGRFSFRPKPRRGLAWLSVAALLLIGATMQLSRPPVEQRPLLVALDQDKQPVGGVVVEGAEPKPGARHVPSESLSRELLVSAPSERSSEALAFGDRSAPTPGLVVELGEAPVDVGRPTVLADGEAASATPMPRRDESNWRMLSEIEPSSRPAPSQSGSNDVYAFGYGSVPVDAKALGTPAASSAPRDHLAAVPASPQASNDSVRGGRRVQPRFYGGDPPQLGDLFGERQSLERGVPLRFREPPSRDRYAAIHENPFVTARGGDAVSTFSVDVDTASYAGVRQYLLGANRLPPADAVRIEELVNYFEYDYAGPEPDEDAPFAAAMEVGPCPWRPAHRLVRIGVKGREIEFDKRPLSNLVFLVDVSGSMNQPNKLPLLVDGLKRLTRQLGENDRVAIVVYASSEGVALPSTSGAERGTILAALDRLRAGGSTAGGAGIRLAYDLAERNFIPGGVNRVLLCTDGDFNVGVTDINALGDLVEHKARETGVFLSVLGFGRGNLNDEMMETVSGRGNGVYAYLDTDREAHRVLVRQMSGTLVTIAKDVKLQVEFNPQRVAGYRLIGYENRLLKTEDFNDDTKDAGEIGAGHTATALYEVVPVGATPPGSVDPLKYQPAEAEEPTDDRQPPTAVSNELLTLKIRYKLPDEDESTKLEFPLVDDGAGPEATSADFRFACSVAEFGMLLRDSPHKGAASFSGVLELAEQGLAADPHGDRSEFVGLVRKAKQLRGE